MQRKSKIFVDLKTMFSNNKKAITSFDMMMTIPRLFFLILVLLSIVILVRSQVITEIDIFEAESSLLTHRLLYSKNGISYYDEKISRIYPGIIDLDKLNQDDIQELLYNSIFYSLENKKIAANITIKDMDGNIIKSIAYNEFWFKEWIKKLEAGLIKGPGGVRGKVKQVYVLIKQGDTLKKGILETVIIIPNS